MSRHHASRRRSYGRRQHELHERRQPLEPWHLEGGLDPDAAADAFSGSDGLGNLDGMAGLEEAPGLQLGHLFGRQGWRWAQGRG